MGADPWRGCAVLGLAAIQIARMRGARIAATVSSPDKQALVALFGAEKIYNSRSTAFLDEIQGGYRRRSTSC